MVSTETAADLLVRIDATTESLRRELARGERAVQQTDRRINAHLSRIDRAFGRTARVVQAAGGAFAALGAGVAATRLGQIGRDAIDTTRQIQDLANTLGVGVENLQALNFAFRQVGAAEDDVGDALSTIADKAQDAIEGSKGVRDEFGLLGVAVADLRGKRPAELFELVAEGVAQVEDPTRRTAAIMQLFGDDLGQRIAPLLIQGAEGLRRYADEAQRLNQVMGAEFVRAGAQAAEQLRLLETAAQTAFRTGVVEGFTGEVHNLDRAMREVAELAVDLGNALGQSMAWATENAKPLVERMQRIARLASGIVGAIQGAGLGSRVGGRYGGLVGGGVAAIGGFYCEGIER